jgi:hypothetical protein
VNRYCWTELIGYPVFGVVDQLEEHCFGNRLQRRFTIANVRRFRKGGSFDVISTHAL